MTELLPCPFCGGEANRMWREWDSGAQDYWIECSKCYAETITFHEEAEAIEAWNTRAERTCRCTTDEKAWCFACSECGKTFPRSNLRYAYNHGEINYCPNCGAKVVEP